MSYFASRWVESSQWGFDTSLLPNFSGQETVDRLAQPELVSPGSLSSEAVGKCRLRASPIKDSTGTSPSTTVMSVRSWGCVLSDAHKPMDG